MTEKTRRRGPELEDALLGAAWAELRRTGYDGFTIDAVAKAAGTSRAVVYRRWPNRAALVHAAVRAHLGSIADLEPATGDLREDTRTILWAITKRIDQVGVDVMTGLLSELDELPESLTATMPDVFRRVVDQARDRGEIGPGAVPEAVLEMPAVLARYEMMATRNTPSAARIDSIVDELFVPLVHRYAGQRRAQSASRSPTQA